MRRYGLLDDQWFRIRDQLPGRDSHVGVNAAENRLFVKAVIYRYRAGIPWRDLPERFGDWKNVHPRHSLWSKAGVGEQVAAQIRRRLHGQLHWFVAQDRSQFQFGHGRGTSRRVSRCRRNPH